MRAEVTVTGLISTVIGRAVVCRLQRLASGELWPTEDLTPGFDPRAPHSPDPAREASAGIELADDGEFWQDQMFRGLETAPAVVQWLEMIDAAAGVFRGVVMVEPHHIGRPTERLRFSGEEVEFIPLATPSTAWAGTDDRNRLPPPVYFDQVELPPEAIASLV